MRIRYLIVCFILPLIAMCIAPISPGANKMTNFTLFTSPRIDSNHISISIVTYDTLNQFPNIFIDGRLPDSTFNLPNSCYWVYFKSVDADSMIDLQIEINNDTLKEGIIIPGEIDSLLCNDKYLYNRNIYFDSISKIDMASSYRFTWKTKKSLGYFYVEYYGSITNDARVDTLMADSILTIMPVALDSSSGYLSFQIENLDGPFINTYNKVSEKIGICYSIRPPTFWCNIRMLK